MSTANLPILEFVLTNYKNFNARATRDALCLLAPHRARRKDVLGRRGGHVLRSAGHHARAGDSRGADPRAVGHRREPRGVALPPRRARQLQDFPDYRYFTKQDDTQILEQRMRRVTDTSIPEDEAFRAVEKIIVPMWKERDARRQHAASGTSTSTSSCRRIGADLYEGNPEECWLLAAARAKLPMVVPGYEDSTFGNIFASHVKLGECSASIVKSGIEYMADFYDQYRELSSRRGRRLLPDRRRHRGRLPDLRRPVDQVRPRSSR